MKAATAKTLKSFKYGPPRTNCTQEACNLGAKVNELYAPVTLVLSTLIFLLLWLNLRMMQLFAQLWHTRIPSGLLGLTVYIPLPKWVSKLISMQDLITGPGFEATFCLVRSWFTTGGELVLPAKSVGGHSGLIGELRTNRAER